MEQDVFARPKLALALALVLLVPVLLLSLRLSAPWDMLLAGAYGLGSALYLLIRTRRTLAAHREDGHE
ncbi:MAG: hypothetical protein ACOY4L_10025 [Pseudomonadota bacterium]